MHDLVTDKSFDKERSINYKLSIQCTLDGFSFSVACPGQNKLLAFKHSTVLISERKLIARRFNEWINQEDILKLNYSETEIILESPEFSIFPENFSNKKFLKPIFNDLFQKNKKNEVLNNNIESLNTSILFSVSKEFKKICEENFGRVNYVHLMSKTLSKLTNPLNKHSAIILFPFSQQLYIISINQGDVQLVNSFKTQTISDILYYAVSSAKHSGLHLNKTKLYCHAEFYENKNLQNSLEQYFDSVFDDLRFPTHNFDRKQFSISEKQIQLLS